MGISESQWRRKKKFKNCLGAYGTMVCQRIEKIKGGEAVYKAFKPDKLNYELGEGNAVHMHWNFFPRREGDIPVKGPDQE